jgi:hypothetical protein
MPAADAESASTPASAEAASAHASAEVELAMRAFVPSLGSAQNEDGGWGFRSGLQSRVEPTAWALLALLNGEAETANPLRSKAFEFLRRVRLRDGSWPAAPGQTSGCWVTSLASWAMLADAESKSAVQAGLRWICEDWPRDTGLIRRTIRNILLRTDAARQNDKLHGWGWTPRTASWVEPTALALIALEQAPKELLPSGADKRRAMAKLMIYDRMCSGGGWNCGNPMVYGVHGDPSVGPTAWALLALRNEPENEKKTLSLQWLEGNLSGKLGPASLALAKICLESYGRAWPSHAPQLADVLEKAESSVSVPTMAWAYLALSGWRCFLKPEAR